MTKAFFEAFPGVSPDDEMICDLLRHTQVTRLTMDPEKTVLKVYLDCDRLISRKDMEKVQETVEEQITQPHGMKTRIIERFHLSKLYTARNLMKAYRASILYELRRYQKCIYTMFKSADISFTDDDTCVVTVEDTLIYRSYADELKRILDKIFTERCGVDLKLTIAFRKPNLAENSSRLGELEYQERLRQVKGAALAGSQEETSGKEEPVADHAPASDHAQTGQKKKAGKGGRYSKKGRRAGSDKPLKLSDHPDVVYGRDFNDDAIEILSITDAIGTVTIRGQVSSLEIRNIHTKAGNDLSIVLLNVTDFTDTMSVKLFIAPEQCDEFTSQVGTGTFLKIKGVVSVDKYDSELSISNVSGMKKIADFRVHRIDNAPVKRVELHCHTKMSRMDAVADVSSIVKTAVSWGHSAIAVTDHGGVQALPDAWHAVPKESDFKIIYGCEAYLVDDEVQAVVNAKDQTFDGSFVVFDLETTGFSPVDDRIIEIGAVRIENGKITGRFSEFVNPQIPIPFRIEQLTSINDSMVQQAQTIEEVLPRFLEFCDGAALAGHNVFFDVSFIEENCDRLGIAHDFTYADTVTLARCLLPNLSRFKLDTVAKALNIPLGHHHRAVDDAECTAAIFLKFLDMLHDRKIFRLDEVNENCRPGPDQIRHLHYYHIILLAQNETGRVNLYRCVSESHLKYMFNGRPMLPRSFLSAHREGLIIGSACEAGELFQAIERGAARKELKKLVDFYDYLEIQPLGNNMFLTVPKYDKQGNLKNEPKTVDDLKKYNRRVVALGEEYGKPVVATCDVHFLNPEDEIYRRILQFALDFDEADDQPPLYLRTTEEMLKEFEYLGEEKALEVVIRNPNMIADQVERFSPVRPDKCPPVIPNSDEMLTRICYDKAHEIYGDELPEIVEERLKRELNSIISNGFAVMYIIAQKLVWKSVADGYLVGSRGSVGSSFVANMAGITEVNSLHPHYLCPSCHYVDFDSELVRKFDGMAGCDMPDRECPNCGTKLDKLGFDIPFETFLGFKGNKEPDIDLNFSGEYQSKAHKYTEVIFGAGQTFRAGTVTGVADKTAFGYVKKYFEDHGENKRTAEVVRIANGCVDVRKSTGQHPGGIIVLPYGEEINTFTPVQHPPTDDATVTTHFDYHKIDHNLLKLDILGHDDPTMIRMLEDLTGVNARQIPLDDRKVMSLFQNTDALGIKPEDIGGCPLGSLGIPEFGTEFAIQMLVDTKPRYFSDLVRIAGLAHGTDVWQGNAEVLIKEGKATIQTAICTRDDIMLFLIKKGMDPQESFKIMESVRKGKGLTPDWEADMRAHDVPEWYIGSCKKIKYMFPKAHAAAYVTMSLRVAYYKVFYKEAYYAAYYTVRADGFDYDLMCNGLDRAREAIREIDAKDKKDTTAKDKEIRTILELVVEMYCRGLEFVPIDLYKSDSKKFIITEDKKLLPPFNSISGMGITAAESIVEARKDGEFTTIEDFLARTKVSRTLVDVMKQNGFLADMPETDQMSLF